MSWYRIDERREISADFITCAEYQLFLDEKRAQGEYRQPDHWDGCQFPKGCAQEPILGVRGEDADRFCEWLSQRQGNQFKYRLPMQGEISGCPGIVREDIGCWCVMGGKRFIHGINSIQWKKWQEFFFSAFTRDWDRPSIYDLALTFARIRNLNLSHILDLDFDRHLNHHPDRVSALARTRAFSLACAIASDLGQGNRAM